MAKQKTRFPFILLGLVVFGYILSAINPYNRLAWLGQSTPAVLYVLLLVFLYPRFRFTNFAYLMVFLHVLLLLYGAHYTYSNNPIRSEEHTSELQSRGHLVCRLLLENKKI